MISNQHDDILYRQSELTEIIQLRHDVLIVGTIRTSPYFDGDQFDSTYHFGAFYSGQNICCLSMMRTELDNLSSYQLRGMATHPDWQGKRIGKKLLSWSELYILEHTGIGDFWCNARVGVEGFYLRQGWNIDSDPFMIEGVCMHLRMKKHLNSSK